MHRRGGIAAATVSSLLLLGACAGDPASPAPTGSATSEGGGSSPSQTSDSTEITITATGDILPHESVIADADENAPGEAYDFSPMFKNVSPILKKGDVAMCHLESAVSPTNTNLTQRGVLSFNSPHEVVDAIKGAGYDGCDFAMNHSWDRGAQGIKDTRSELVEAGLEYAGPTVKPGIERRRAVYETQDVRIDQLAYTYTIYNSGSPTTEVPPGQPALGASLWPKVGAEGIIADAKQSKKDGADFVVVSMHWGTQYQSAPNARQKEMAQKLLSSDAVDLILGTHAHVVQPCQKINGKYVMYGMGNFLSNQSPSQAASLPTESQEGVIVTFTLEKDGGELRTTSMTYQPTRVDIEDHVIELATPKQHEETYDRVVDTMNLLGEDACDAKPAR